MTSGFQIPHTGASLRVHSILVDEEAAASYSQSICPNLIFLIVDGAGPGCGLFKVFELAIDLLHFRVISGSGAGVTGAEVLLAVEFELVELALVELLAVVLVVVAFEVALEAESLDVVVFAEVVLLSELEVVVFEDVVELLELVDDSVELLEAEAVELSEAVDVVLLEVDSPDSFLRSLNLLRPPPLVVVELSVEVLLEVVESLAAEVSLGSNSVGKSTPVMTNFLVESS